MQELGAAGERAVPKQRWVATARGGGGRPLGTLMDLSTVTAWILVVAFGVAGIAVIVLLPVLTAPEQNGPSAKVDLGSTAHRAQVVSRQASRELVERTIIFGRARRWQ